MLTCLLLFISYYFIHCCDCSGGADWNAPNIVIQDGQWVQIPDDYFNDSVYKQPPLPYDDKYLRNDTSIIVLIASFRETRCKDTLFNLFTKAAHPNRIFIGIVQQNEPEPVDEDCVYEYCKLMNDDQKQQNDEWNADNCPYYDNIKINRMAASDAKGPVYARALQVELVDDEDYCMQIDAHSDVYPSWDVLMLQEWGKCRNEYAVISTYPSNIRDIGRNSNKHWEMPHLCEAAILGMGQVRNGRAKAAAGLTRPILAPLWAAGLSFSRCHAEKRVPNDVNLKHVFNGEEFSRGARLWTHGYDFYSPSRAYIGTYYQSEKGNKGSWKVNREELQISNQRMGSLLKYPNSDQSQEAIGNLGRYAIGTQRSLEQYIKFCGVDTINHNVDMSDKCILHWTPFDHQQIKYEIMAMNENNENHQKIGIEKPHENNLQNVDDINFLIENHALNDKLQITTNTSYEYGMIWIIGSLLCLTAIILIIYKQKIRKKCIDMRLQFKSEQHIV